MNLNTTTYSSESASIDFQSKKTYNNNKFEHKNITLFCGNSLEETFFNNKFIDLIVTSPPYNVGIEYNSNNDELSYEDYLSFSRKWMANCYKWSNTQARFCLNIPLDKNNDTLMKFCADLLDVFEKYGINGHILLVCSAVFGLRKPCIGTSKCFSLIAPHTNRIRHYR